MITGHSSAARVADTDGALAPAPRTSHASPARAAWFRLALFLVVVALALGTVVAGSHALPAPERERFDRETARRVRKRKPDLVLLGNSMVNSRFHEATLRELLRPLRVMVIGVPGSKTAHWYLMLKNQILAGKHRPQRVLIFFYGEELTQPEARATGAETWRAERVSPEDDPVVTRKLAPDWHDPIARLSWQLGRLVPVGRVRARSEGPTHAWATQVSAWLQPEPDESARSTAINGLFELDALRTSSAQPEPEPRGGLFGLAGRKLSFAEQMERSFVPDILALARDAKVNLVFLHIRERASAEGQPLPPGYPEYLKRIQHYLNERGVGFVDLTPNEWEQASFYGENSHLKHRVRGRYTRLFVQNMPSLFE